jgi:hypothetical protein
MCVSPEVIDICPIRNPIRNLILRARDAIKTTGSLSLLRGFPESRATTLTENRVRILRKIRYVLVTAQTFT